MISQEHFVRDCSAIRQVSPLVHNITNLVAMDFSANALLALGASPIMAHASEEMEDVCCLSDALLVNIGTLDSLWVRGMWAAGESMQRLRKPIVFDPVGVGVTGYRTRTACEFIRHCRPAIIRGNAAEIMALAETPTERRGVDSLATSEEALVSAKGLAKAIHAVVVISGATDYITDGKETESLRNGSPLQTRVTAMGCTASAVVAAFAAVNPNFFEAATHAMALMGVVGEMAAEMTLAPGSLRTKFIDLLFTLTPEEILQKIRQ